MRDIRVGIDVGGTFTDFVLAARDRDGVVEVRRHKSPSTPSDPSLAVVTGLRDLVRDGLEVTEIRAITHGTTIGLNAIIQRSGARVTLVVSRGYRDLLELGRSRMPRSFDLHARPEQPPVPRDRVMEIDARLGPDGRPLRTPDAAEVGRVARQVSSTNPESVALVVIEGFTNPVFEQGLAERLQAELEGVPIIAASVAWPVIREYERALVAVLSAHIHPLMSRYFTRLSHQLTDLGITAPLFITGSNGGSLSVTAAAEQPLDTVLSGPASGVTAAERILGSEKNLITFDMGGTSSDIAVIVNGHSTLTTSAHVGGLPLILPVVDVNAIGSGGGSVAWVDLSGSAPVLAVGPRSAGAVPGPACYGMGGQDATVTDAYLVSGMIDAERFLGGAMRLHPERAEAALAALAATTGIGPGDGDRRARAVALADDVLRVATAQMATEMRKLLAHRGQDAPDFALVPYGGAGPTHAALLAEEVGIDSIVVPEGAATFCAMGAAVSPLRQDFARSVRRPLDARTLGTLREVLEELHERARAWIRDNGGPGAQSTVRVSADMRYLGQAYEITVPLGEVPLPDPLAASPVPLTVEAVLEAFQAEHRRLYSFADPGATVELATARLAVLGPDPALAAPAPPATTAPPSPLGRRRMRWHGRWYEADVLWRSDLPPHHTVTGPVLIEQDDTAVVVPPGWVATNDVAGNLRLTRRGQ